jgi:hypothetical protein
MHPPDYDSMFKVHFKNQQKKLGNELSWFQSELVNLKYLLDNPLKSNLTSQTLNKINSKIMLLKFNIKKTDEIEQLIFHNINLQRKYYDVLIKSNNNILNA